MGTPPQESKIFLLEEQHLVLLTEKLHMVYVPLRQMVRLVTLLTKMEVLVPIIAYQCQVK